MRPVLPAAEDELVESVVTDPYAHRRVQAFRLRQGLSLLFGLVEGLIILRLVLLLLGANPTTGPFAALIYRLTGPMVAPFTGIFPVVRTGPNILEPQSILAIIIYALLAWVLIKLVWLILGEPRTGTMASTRRSRTRIG